MPPSQAELGLWIYSVRSELGGVTWTTETWPWFRAPIVVLVASHEGQILARYFTPMGAN